MHLYEIVLPVKTNAGQSYARELLAWEDRALRIAGGYTALPHVQGAWNDNGVTFSETMAPYRVACDPKTWEMLVADAFRTFSDQLAIFVAIVGTAEIIERNPEHAASANH